MTQIRSAVMPESFTFRVRDRRQEAELPYIIRPSRFPNMVASAPLPDEPNGEPFFLAQLETIERVISFVASRRHLSGADADDFGSHVKLKLIENDYAILRKFQGRSSLRTFLTVVIQRMFLDYRISSWGKWRPSAEAKREGEIAILLERLTTREGHTFEEACELMETNHQITVSRSALEAMAGRLPHRIRRRFESEEALAGIAAAERPLEEILADQERAITAARVETALKKAMESLEAQDRLIFAWLFRDGRTLAAVSRALHVDQKALYRQRDRCLKALLASLETAGIDQAQALEMFKSSAVSIDWEGDTEEMRRARPSVKEGEQEWR